MQTSSSKPWPVEFPRKQRDHDLAAEPPAKKLCARDGAVYLEPGVRLACAPALRAGAEATGEQQRLTRVDRLSSGREALVMLADTRLFHFGDPGDLPTGGAVLLPRRGVQATQQSYPWMRFSSAAA